jgi:hypothetical protein
MTWTSSSAVVAAASVAATGEEAIERARQTEAELMATARQMSWPVGALFLGLALLPTFFGWRLLRITNTILLGAFGAMIAFDAMSGLASGPGLALVAAGVCAIVGAIIGWNLFHLQVAFTLAAVLAAVGYVLSSRMVLGGDPIIVVGVTVGAFFLGLILGWAAAPTVAIVQTALAGALLAGFGVAVVVLDLLKDPSLYLVRGLVLAVLIPLFFAGMSFQFRQRRRQRV